MANQSLTVLLRQDAVKAKVAERLGASAPAVLAALVDVYNNNTLLQKCDPKSILRAAVKAGMSKLDLSKGEAYIVPYGDQAQFQLGWRGLVQLAMRSGQYKALNTR